MQVRAKFRVESKDPHRFDTGDIGNVVLRPVYSDDPNHENKQFWDATPSGIIEMYITNPAAFAEFTVGQEKFIDFSDGGLSHADSKARLEELESLFKNALTVDQMIEQGVVVLFAEMLDILQDDAGVHVEMEDYSNMVFAVRNDCGWPEDRYLGYGTYKDVGRDETIPFLALFDMEGKLQSYWNATNHDLLAEWKLVKLPTNPSPEDKVPENTESVSTECVQTARDIPVEHIA